MGLLLTSKSAAAQDDAPLTPPSLVVFVPAEAPGPTEAPLAVLLELTVAEDGSVSDAGVLQSAGSVWDEAALDAVRRFRFEPARKGDKPVRVTIRYRYVFEPTPPAKSPALAPEKPRPPAPVEPPRAAAPAAPAAPEVMPEYEGVAQIDAPPSEPTKRSLEGPVLTRVPGTRGDALRAIEVLPGVGRTGLDEGEPLLRGAASSDSQVLIDGAPVPLLFHFGGLTSVYQSRLIQRVDLYPSNFGVRYGRAIGGIVEVTTRDPRTDRFHGMLELSLLENSVLVEAPLTDDLAVALAARRTNIDFVYESFVPDATFDVVAAPVYYDYQASATWRLGARHTLRFRGLGSRDALELFFADPLPDSPTLSGNVEATIEFQRAGLGLESRWSDAVTSQLQLSVGHSWFDQRVGLLDAELESIDVYVRDSWRLRAERALELRAGIDVAAQFMTGHYFGSRPGQNEGDPSAFSGRNDDVGAEDTFRVLTPAAFVELGLYPTPAVALTPGVRVEYYDMIGEAVVDPRLSTRLELTDATTLKAGVGLYSQAPLYFEALPPVGNDQLEPVRALHTSLGVEQDVAPGVTLGLEGFYKRLWNRVVGTEDGGAPYFETDGIGRIAGVEVSGKAEPSRHTRAYLAYTLQRSERRDHDDAWRLFDADQTHLLSIAAEQSLGRGWTLGGRFRLTSGNPSTPIIGAVYDAARDTYRPVYGAVNSTRNPTFHQLDLRLEKSWRIGVGSLAAYLELINAYNAQNREGTSYSYDYSKSEAISGLPIFPNLGLRGEL